jgi:hypothetical protein
MDAIMSRVYSGPISVEQLLLEGARLVRPCLWLRPATEAESQSGGLAGIWGGPPVVPPPGADWQHVVSVDCAWLQENGYHVQGCISLYRHAEASSPDPSLRTRWVARCAPDLMLPTASPGGVPLVAQLASSFPPLEALCLYGGRAVRQWLYTLGVSRHGYRDPRVYASEAGDAYISEYMKHSPLYINCDDDPQRVAVIVGGWWHSVYLQWDYEHGGDTFLMLTLRDAEPWLEVWQDSAGALHVEAVTRRSSASYPNRHAGRFVLYYG